jgi:hypothetical protein
VGQAVTSEADRLIAEWELIAWAAAHRRRDQIIRAARAAGISKHRIHVLTGIARSTIDRVETSASGHRPHA